NVRFAGDIVRVFADIRRIAHLARASHVPDHPIFSDPQLVALAVAGAPMNSSQNHVLPGLGPQVDVGLGTSKTQSDLGDNLLNELVEVQNRAYLLGCLLQFE